MPRLSLRLSSVDSQDRHLIRKTGIPVTCPTSLEPGGDVLDSRSFHIVGIATKVVSQNWLKVTLRRCLRPRVQKFQFVELPEAFACFVC